MNLTNIVMKELVKMPKINNKDYCFVGEGTKEGLFCSQYLEKPVVSGDYKMAISPTACTIKGIPVIDDF